MKVLGFTGGIGMGKSASARLLRELGVEVVDTDDLAREVVEAGQPALLEIRDAFGPDVIGSDGALRRQELARRVFPHPESRRKLEDILHPKIRALWHGKVEGWRARGCPLGVVVIPLLFETAAEKDFDHVVCVACSPASQQERLGARGWTATEMEQRIQAQLPVETKMTRSHFVIWTEGEMALHAAQLRRILHAVVPANF